MFPFSCVRFRFANRTYGFKTGGLYPNRLATVGCNKRSAVHRDHIADFPPHPQPFSREGRRVHTTDALAQTSNPFAPCHDPAFSQADTVLRG